MKSFIALVVTALLAFPVFAQMTDAQKTTFAAHIRANTDPVVVAALAVRNDGVIADWYNQPTATDAWRVAVSGNDMFEATPITNFDGLTAGKRDAWRLMVDQSQIMPLSFARAKTRNAVVDIWNPAQYGPILQGAREKALQVEMIFGGANETTGAVTALTRNYVGAVSTNEVSVILNQF